MTGLQIQTTISDWRTQWYSDRPLTCCDLVQAVLVSDNRQLPLPRPPVIHDGWYWWSCPAAEPPPQSRDIREQESAAASHGGAHWTALPTPVLASRPPLNEFTARWKESAYWHDGPDAAVHQTKRQAVSSVYSHTASQLFRALIVRYITHANKTLKSMAYSRRKRSRCTWVCNSASSIYKAQYIDATLCKMLISLFMVRT